MVLNKFHIPCLIWAYCPHLGWSSMCSVNTLSRTLCSNLQAF